MNHTDFNRNLELLIVCDNVEARAELIEQKYKKF